MMSAWRVARAAADRFDEVEGLHRAAGLAFWALFSLLPLLLLATSVLEVVLTDSEAFRERLLSAVNASDSPEVRVLLDESLRQVAARGGSGLGFAGAAAGAVLGASGVLVELRIALDRVFRCAEPPVTAGGWARRALVWLRRYLARRLGALLLVGGTSLLVLAAAVAAAAWEAAAPGGSLARWLSGAGSFVVLAGAVAACFRWVPAERPRPSAAVAGGVVASLLLLVLRPALAWVVVRLPAYSASGVVGSVLVVVLWLYVASAALLFGACVAAASEESRKESSNDTVSSGSSVGKS